MRVAAFVFLLHFQVVFALDNAPSLLRVCLDNNTSVATIYWQSVSDPCNSFRKHLLYSSENGGPWKLEKVITNFSAVSDQVVLSDINSVWKFRIVSYYACNGTDSLFSNEMTIDQLKPPLMELDSVSFDPASQLVSAGWNKNSAKDTRGYRIYSYNNAVNNRITDSDSTRIILPGYTNQNPVLLTLAAYDSCNLFSPISNAQGPAYLTGSIDTCTKTVSLNWTPYSGWQNTNQYIVMNKNGKGYQQYSLLSNGSLSEKISGLSFGDSICIYIRTKDVSRGFTSSSNTVCFKLKDIKPPKYNYLSNVTVINNSALTISFETDLSANGDSLVLRRKTGSNPSYDVIKEFVFNSLNPHNEITDINVNVHSETYTYQVIIKDRCKNTLSVSNVGTSVLLNKPLFSSDLYVFNWNPYLKWEQGILEQEFEYTTNSSTWNTLSKLPATSVRFEVNKTFIETDSVCVRIKSNEITNQFSTNAVSYSNTRCLYPVTDYYFPETLNPFSNNNVFRIYGKGYDNNRASMEIFNRWGERIFMTHDIETGWDATLNGTPVDMGNYIYKISFYDQTNKYYFKSGSILIIR